MSEINNGSSFLEDLLNGSEDVTETEVVTEEDSADTGNASPETEEQNDSGSNETANPVVGESGQETGVSIIGGKQAVPRGISTDADIVFVIDSTGSMDYMIDRVKELALTFNERLYNALETKSRMPRKIRMKVIGFRDFFYDIPPYPPIQQSEFFTIFGNDDPAEDAQELQNFKDFVGMLEPRGGEDADESGLEALHLAFKSDWNNDPNVTKRRHIVVLFTDAKPHDLNDPRRYDPDQNPGNNYPEDCPEDLGGLYSEYCAMETEGDETCARRLFLFAPVNGAWEDIIEWDNVQNQKPIVAHTQEVNGEKEIMYDFSGEALFKFLAGSM